MRTTAVSRKVARAEQCDVYRLNDDDVTMYMSKPSCGALRFYLDNVPFDVYATSR